MYIITGATGNVGRHLVRALIEAGARVRALTRAPGAAGLPAGAEVAHPCGPLPAGARGLFLNPAAFTEGFGAVLARAREAGVRRVVTLSSSSVVRHLEANAIAAHHRRLERQVEESGMEWVHLRAGAFASNALRWRTALRSGDAVPGAFPESRLAPVHDEDVARVAAHALSGDEHVGTAPELTGPEVLTHREQVRVLGAVLGRPLRFVELRPEQARAAMVEDGFPARTAEALLQLYAVNEGAGRVTDTVERITGRRPGRYGEWLIENAERFR